MRHTGIAHLVPRIHFTMSNLKSHTSLYRFCYNETITSHLTDNWTKQRFYGTQIICKPAKLSWVIKNIPLYQYITNGFTVWQYDIEHVILVNKVLKSISYSYPPFQTFVKVELTPLPTAFYDFLSYGGGGGFLSHTPENNVKIIWLIWNLVHIINDIRLLRMRNFRKFAVLFLEIWRHKIRLHCVPMFTPGIRI